MLTIHLSEKEIQKLLEEIEKLKKSGSTGKLKYACVCVYLIYNMVHVICACICTFTYVCERACVCQC